MPSAERNIILDQPFRFQFFTDADGAHYLDVLCGRSAAYFKVCVQLTPEERNRYGQFGGYYIEKLALDILHAPGRFSDRNLVSREA